jgi:hypothetical protein
MHRCAFNGEAGRMLIAEFLGATLDAYRQEAVHIIASK